MKLSTAIRGYFLERSFDLAESTVQNYSYIFDHLVEFLDDRDIEGVNKYDILAFLAHLRDDHKVSDHTLYDARARLSSLWTWAVGELGVEHVVAKVPKPKYAEPLILPYSKDEVQRLVDATEVTERWMTGSGKKVVSKRHTANRDKAIILTLLDTGMRAGELCRLTIADYDEKLGRFYIKKGKGKKKRFVVAGRRTQKALWRHLADRPDAKPTEPLFETRDGGFHTPHTLYDLITRLGKRAEVSRAGLHRFRHTFAVEFLRNGGNVFELQELLGHEDLKTVMVYVKLAERDIDAAQRHSPADNWKV